jgi:hypothetical protein
MLDLDSLAERRAKTLNEKQEPWLKAVWSPDFQKISSNMSDGEVEILLSHCKSHVHLEALIGFLTGHKRVRELSPYGLVIEEAKASGLALSDWIAQLANKGV